MYPPIIQQAATTILRWKNTILHQAGYAKKFEQTSHTLDLSDALRYNQQRPLGFQAHLCNAPFTSLYFGVGGEVLACCKNRKKILGNIREQTIEAIWNGQAANELRSAIAENNLSQGCGDCQGGIQANNYASVMALAYDSLQAKKQTAYPQRLDFELSSTCNLACVMCTGYLSSTYRKHFEKAEPYAMAYDNTFPDQLSPFIPHVKKANFYGGEPFLIDLYFPIWEMFRKSNPGCTIFIQTNGLVLNNRVKTLLENGKYHLGISLESLQEKTYEQIRLFGQYKKLMHNLEYFRAYCKHTGTGLSLAITPLRHTVSELPDFVRFANSIDTPLYFNIATEPHDLSLWPLEADTLFNIHRELSAVELPHATSVEKNNRNQYLAYLNQIEHWAMDSRNRTEQMKALQLLQPNEIRQILFQKINTYLAVSGKTGEKKTQAFLEQMDHKLSGLIQKDPNIYREKLIFYCTLPEDRFVHEFIMHEQP